MTQVEVKEVATELARKLGSYPMLITILLLIGLISYMWWSEQQTAREAIQKLVFTELEWKRTRNDKLIDLLNECYTGAIAEKRISGRINPSILKKD